MGVQGRDSGIRGRLWASYEATVLDRPRRCLLLVALVVALFASQVPGFSLDASSDSLLLESDTGIHYYRAVRARYGNDDYLIVTWNPGRPMFSGEALDTLERLREALAGLPEIRSVVSILDVPLLESPPLTQKELADGAPTLLDPRTDLGLARRELRESPLYRDRLMSADGSTTALQVNLAREDDATGLRQRRAELLAGRLDGRLDRDARRELAGLDRRLGRLRAEQQAETRTAVAAVRDVVDRFRESGELHVGGVPLIHTDMIRFIRHDLVVFGTGLVVALVVLLAFVFRRPRSVLLPLVACAATVVSMLGLLSVASWPVTVVSSNFVSLMLILTLSLNVHLVVRYRELHGAQPEASQRELVRATVRNKFQPALYTALTTMIAFASLLVSDIRPVIDFGWMMVIGMALAFAMTFLVLPSALMLTERGRPPALGHFTNRVTGLFAALITRWPRITLAAFGLLTLVSLAGLAGLSVDNRFIDYFKSDTDIHQGMRVIDEKLGGTTPLDIILDAAPGFGEEAADADDELAMLGDPGFAATSYWYNTARLGTLRQAHDHVAALPDVGKVLSLATTADVLRQFTGGDALDNLELSVAYERLPADVRAQLIDPYLSDDGNEARIAARVFETSDELERDRLLAEIREYLTGELGLAPEQVHLTGLMVLYNNVLQSLMSSQVTTAGVVAVLVVLMFVVSFRSITVACLALAPTAISAAFVLGLMSLSGIPLDIMTITIAAIAIGIGVDNTIHYVYRFREEFAECRDYPMTIRRCHESIGHAIYYTSIIVMLGFSILALSSFVPTIYFGLLTGLAMLIALVANLTLLPLLLGRLQALGEPGDESNNKESSQ